MHIFCLTPPTHPQVMSKLADGVIHHFSYLGNNEGYQDLGHGHLFLHDFSNLFRTTRKGLIETFLEVFCFHEVTPRNVKVIHGDTWLTELLRIIPWEHL